MSELSSTRLLVSLTVRPNFSEVKYAHDSDEETRPQQLEVFEPPVLDELKLKFEWTMWEHYETLQHQTAAFED